MVVGQRSLPGRIRAPAVGAGNWRVSGFCRINPVFPRGDGCRMNPAFLLLPKRQPQPAARLDRRIQPVATCLRIGTPDLSGRSPPVAASCRMNPAFRVSAHVNLVQMSGCSPDLMLSAKKVARDAPPIQSSCTGGRDGRVVEGTRLESVHTPKGYRGFDSLSLRQTSLEA